MVIPESKRSTEMRQVTVYRIDRSTNILWRKLRYTLLKVYFFFTVEKDGCSFGKSLRGSSEGEHKVTGPHTIDGYGLSINSLSLVVLIKPY